MKEPKYSPLRMNDKKYAEEYALAMKKYIKHLQKTYRETNVNNQ